MRRYLFAGFLSVLTSSSMSLCAVGETTSAAIPTMGAASSAAVRLAQLVLDLGLATGLILLLA